jgi:hypothetical protein
LPFPLRHHSRSQHPRSLDEEKIFSPKTLGGVACTQRSQKSFTRLLQTHYVKCKTNQRIRIVFFEAFHQVMQTTLSTKRNRLFTNTSKPQEQAHIHLLSLPEVFFQKCNANLCLHLYRCTHETNTKKVRSTQIFLAENRKHRNKENNPAIPVEVGLQRTWRKGKLRLCLANNVSRSVEGGQCIFFSWANYQFLVCVVGF